MRDIGIIARFELRRVVRSTGGVLFAALAVILYAYVGIKLAKWNTELLEAKAMAGPGQEILSGGLGWLVELEGSQLSEMMKNHSPFALVFFFVALAINPLLSLLASSDQTASDIQTRHIRYLLLRTSRSSLFWGKALGTLIFYAVAMLVLVGCIAGAGVFTGAVPASELLYFGRIWLTLTLFAVPFIALNGLAAALTGHPGLALMVSFGYYAVVWLISALGGWFNDAIEKVAYLSPSALKFDLAAESLGGMTSALGHMAAFTVVALLLGSTLFNRRDV